MKTPVCATCGQPGTRELSQDDSWECGNEACSEFGQPLDDNEPSVDLTTPDAEGSALDL